MFYSMPYSSFANAADAVAAQGAAREAKTDVELLKHDVNRVLMITEALWTFMKKQHGYTDDDLRNLVQQIDLRDGKPDGQTAKEQPLQMPELWEAKFGETGVLHVLWHGFAGQSVCTLG